MMDFNSVTLKFHARLVPINPGDTDAWQHPCLHELHYGEAHRDQFSETGYVPRAGQDEDLAAHFTVARARGVDLLGNYPIEKLPEIPRLD